MDTLGEALKDFLSSLSTGTRAWPLNLPERATLPCLVWTIRQSTGPVTSHGDAHTVGGSPIAPTTTVDQVEVVCWGRTYQDAEALAVEVFNALHAFVGQWGDLDVGSVFVDGVFDRYDRERSIFGRAVSARVRYSFGESLGS